MSITSTVSSQPTLGQGFGAVPTRVPSDPVDTTIQTNPQVLEGLGRIEAELASLHRVCCEAWLSQCDYENALRHMDVAAALEPDNLEFRNQVGYLRYITGDDRALEDFEFILRQDATNGEAWYNVGMVQFGCSRFLEAERAFANAAEQIPTDSEIWNNLGVARFQLGRVAEARQCFERALQIDPMNADARANIESCN